jgi:hypothetical protein
MADEQAKTKLITIRRKGVRVTAGMAKHNRGDVVDVAEGTAGLLIKNKMAFAGRRELDDD